MRQNHTVVIVFFITVILILMEPPGIVAITQNRGVELLPLANELGSKIGKQYLVLIAVNRYQNWMPLRGPVRNAEEIKEILESRYYMDKVIRLYDEAVTRKGIIKLFSQLEKNLNSNDSALIFYAGHGHSDSKYRKGYWIPVDAGTQTDQETMNGWISIELIRKLIGKIKAKHILLISDSCYAGNLLDIDMGLPPKINNEWFREAYSLRSRQVITSSSHEITPDDSEFAYQLKMVLGENNETIIDPLTLYDKIRRRVDNTHPLFGELKGTGHQKGGTFLFFLRRESINVAIGESNEEDRKWQIPDSNEEILWSLERSKMPTARSQAISVAVGKDIYTFGGHGGRSTYSLVSGMRENEVYHTTSDDWDALPLVPLYRGCYDAATAFINDKIFFFGGANPPGTGHYNYINEYDTKTNTWKIDRAVLPFPLAAATAVTYKKNIYIFGGRSGAESGHFQPFRKLSIKFDPDTYRYTNLSELPSYFSGAKAFVKDGLLYLAGGVKVEKSLKPYGRSCPAPVLIYAPAKDRWIIKKKSPPSRGMPLMVHGKIYIIKSDLSVAYKYEDITDSWSSVGSRFRFPSDISGGFVESSSFEVVGNKIYILGGMSHRNKFLSQVIVGTIQSR